jgi:transposase
MLDQAQRTAILELHRRGQGKRTISRALGISRGAVRRVIASASSAVPKPARAFKAESYREQILELHSACKGNLVRVHEELAAEGVELSYPALTGFCRRAGIGHKAKVPVGRYHFDPGQEMQHDTSPHELLLDGRRRRAQTASLVLCYSRLLFFQFYPRFTRFDCKVFLTEALRYVGGACGVCMIDNTHLVVLKGTGSEMIPVPEMAAFGERFGFEFRAHEKGDANRSARVERPFDYIDNNFLAGRGFADWQDANQQARAWCDRVNARFKRHLRASPCELFATERPQLQPLPLWVPQVYQLHHRLVDTEGYVSVNTNRYSVPPHLIGRRVEVRETAQRIEIYEGPRRVAEHRRRIDPIGQRHTLPEHRPPRGQGRKRHEPLPEERRLLETAPEIRDYVTALKRRGPGRGTLALRRLLQMVREYPRAPLLRAIRTAADYGLYDLERVERMVLREIAGEYFVLNDNGYNEEPNER